MLRAMSSTAKAAAAKQPQRLSSAAVLAAFAKAHAPAAATAAPLPLAGAQLDTVRQFATLHSADWLRVGPNMSRADVLSSILSSSAAPALDQQLAQAPETDVQRKYREKYMEKLKRKANEEGASSIDELIARKKDEELQRKRAEQERKDREDRERRKREEESKNRAAAPAAVASSSSSPSSAALPSYAKKLNQIMRIELLESEPADKIAAIWNQYHATKECLSATVEADFYRKLYKRGRELPMFLLPLPRGDGYELFLMQFSGHQIYYTTLLEYKTHREGARPSLVVTHFDDFADSKSLVLMVGELGESNSGSLKLPEAQNLVYQTQLFYVTGNDAQRELVDKFGKDPQSFDYQELIKAVETLS
ncbi:hypothetical protein HK105_208736 [Polyrhizophydium stewartii]|uniref:ATP synthase mitochondrial F1 complex assembly factor 1 n=1 Tax=Polyrhizophydium stewartii TaxID=2732419 RepID=A0ABR4MX07_9FUNG|nr:hypothetical protein HK105_001184 [Polyrhizophydium stewartii]